MFFHLNHPNSNGTQKFQFTVNKNSSIQNLSSNVKSCVEYLFINICFNTVVYKHIKLL
jgi:hypothetical protein